MIGLILAGLSLKQKIITGVAIIAIIAAVFGAGYWIGHIKGAAAQEVRCVKQEVKTQKKRAVHAEKQRDIANAPPASVDAMLDWLSGAPAGSR